MKNGASEEETAGQVLGVTYRDLGIGVARHWNFPDKLVEGREPQGAGDHRPSESPQPSREGGDRLLPDSAALKSSTDRSIRAPDDATYH